MRSSFWSRLVFCVPLIVIAVIAVLVGLALFFFPAGKQNSHPGMAIPFESFMNSTAPNPFPNLPQVLVAPGSGVITIPKSDWGADESPTITVHTNKLPVPSSTEK
jgi:hypothetical protein